MPASSSPVTNRPLRTRIALAILLLSVARSSAAEITVFAAVSLADALKEIGKSYENASGDRVRFNFAASSLLARQIAEGAPADIFFSADEAKMDDLARKGLIVADSRRSRLGNSLVIVVAADSPIALGSAKDLATEKVKRLALAEPKTVPAGIYAKEYLSTLKLWPAIEPKVVPTENVRAALAAVESGNVEAGIVYQTDASISKKVKVAVAVSPADGPKITYPVALLKESKQPAGASGVLHHLNGAAAGAVFKRYGFIVRD
ncbi:MAG: molybdate ABC transporter substrate-binding protein [Verrucomicrobia bacterium]|nr:molybdate ABC transporter substrate-binding protein [Verrucomicrobiota bacterium]